MGWNNIKVTRSSRPRDSRRDKQGDKVARILKGVPDGAYMYFVHSYYVEPEDKDIVLTTTDYGIRFVSGVAKDNVYGFQFHPEKSQAVGLRILKNFVSI